MVVEWLLSSLRFVDELGLSPKEPSVLGLGVSGSKKAAYKGGCMCSVCQLSRACKKSPAKMRVFEQECTRPLVQPP